MKNLILAVIAIFGISATSQAQLLKLGVKAGPNFSNFSGGISDINYKSRTSFHAGLVAEVKVLENFSVQPELLYSSQGAKVEFIVAQFFNGIKQMIVESKAKRNLVKKEKKIK